MSPASAESAPSHTNRGVRRLRAKRSDALGLDAHEVADLYGIGVAGFYRLLAANPDHPRRTSPLWPGGRGKFDRASCVRWWRAFVAKSRRRQEQASSDNEGKNHD